MRERLIAKLKMAAASLEADPKPPAAEAAAGQTAAG